MFKMIRRRALLRCLIVGIISTALFVTFGVAITNKNENDTSAVSGALDLKLSGRITMPVAGVDHSTTYIKASGFDDGTHDLFCVQPETVNPPEGEFTDYAPVTVDTDDERALLLLLFIYRYYDRISVAKAARDDVIDNGDVPSYVGDDEVDAYNYFWIHALAGWLDQGRSGVWDGIWNNYESWIRGAASKLKNYVTSDSDVWRLASQQTLYATTWSHQRLVFIGEPSFTRGEIEIIKCDSATRICGSNGGSMFDRIKFKISNASNERIYIPFRGKIGQFNDYTDKFYDPGAEIATAEISDGAGKVLFQYLAANGVQYKIEETSGNDYYQQSTETVTKTLSSDGQTVTIEFNNDGYGEIVVNKIDSQTGTHTTQGNATFNGTKFTVINKTGHSITYEGRTIENNDEVSSKTLSGGNYSVKFEKLPYGAYEVQETAVGDGYDLNTDVKSVTIPTNGNTTITVSYPNTVKKGKVTVNKIDSETGRCDVRARAHSFAGTTFQIINKSDNPVYIGGTSYAKDAVIKIGDSTTKVFGENDCSFTIDNLPYGKYWIKETVAAPGYVELEDPIEVVIPTTSGSYTLTKEVKNTQIRGDLKFVKMDEGNNNPMPNTLFSISSIDEDFNILETHFVVSNQDGVVDTSNAFARHSFHTNGYDAMYDDGATAYTTIPFLGYGTWFGLDTEGNSLPVNDDLGALPYGKYLIQEMRCDANTFCYDLKDQKKVVTINQNNKTVDLGTWDNNCAVFELGTEAVDGDDGDHYIEADKDVKLVDHIHYCARKGMKFTIKGILMNRETGEPILVNGQTVENSIEVIPEHDDCEIGDDVDMEFIFDGTGYGGEKLVVFETLYYGETEMISHEDLEDDFQTVEMVYIHTSAVNDEDKSKVLPLNEDVVIEDTVDYCLIPGKTYIIRGTLMDRDENAPFLVNGEKVQSEVTVTPEEKCGQAIMYFHINTTGLGGKRLVVFESLYLEDEPENPIVKHEDIYNYDESIDVEPEVPDTGIATRSDKSGESANGAFVVIGGAVVLIGLGGYIFARHSSKKNVMKF